MFHYYQTYRSVASKLDRCGTRQVAHPLRCGKNGAICIEIYTSRMDVLRPIGLMMRGARDAFFSLSLLPDHRLADAEVGIYGLSASILRMSYTDPGPVAFTNGNGDCSEPDAAVRFVERLTALLGQVDEIHMLSTRSDPTSAELTVLLDMVKFTYMIALDLIPYIDGRYALACALHPRLNKTSPMQLLDAHTMKYLTNVVTAQDPRADYARQIAEASSLAELCKTASQICETLRTTSTSGPWSNVRKGSLEAQETDSSTCQPTVPSSR